MSDNSKSSVKEVMSLTGELLSVTGKRAVKAVKNSKKHPAKLTAKQLKKRKKRRNRIIRRTVLSIFTAILCLVIGLIIVLGTVFYGPSQMASDLLTVTLLETSALKFVPRMFFSEAGVQAIVERNKAESFDEITDTSLIVINTGKDEVTGETEEEYKDVELVNVTGPTYKGYMLIVRDPSRVSVGVCHKPFGDTYGKYIDEIAEEYNALAVINAGGFEDDGGTGKGGIPIGIVYADGELMWTHTDDYYSTLVGFDKDDKLIVVDNMSSEQSKSLNLRDAVTFGPALVVNGEAAVITGSGSGTNPRTAIGQRADGAVLLLVIDGRQVNSLGATMSDLIDIMLDFGAVNAANLDGGSSSKMYYDGAYINDGVALTGSRRMCTTFIVR